MKTPFATTTKYNVLAAMIVVGIILFIAVAALFVSPQWGKLKSVNRQVASVRVDRAQHQADKDGLDQIKKVLDNTNRQNDVQNVTNALPEDPKVPNILALLETLSKSHNITLSSFTPQQVAATTGTGAAPAPTPGSGGANAQNTGGASTIDITANYTGNYPDLLAFFFDLERSLRIVDVQSLSVSTEVGSAGIHGNITFRAYYLAPPSNSTASTDTTGGAK